MTASGKESTVCYKDCRYGFQDAPGLIDHPARFGIPEYAVYSRADIRLRAFLPAVYHCEEVEPGRAYRYLLEDIRSPFTKPTEAEELLVAAGGLLHVQQAVENWARSTAERALIRYDHALMLQLSDYSERAFNSYAERYPAAPGASRLELNVMLKALTRAEFHELMEPTGVHGDCNRASLLVDPDTGQLKVIDWERAGLGVAHLDLAMLVGGGPRVIERRALRRFADQRPSLSLAEHIRLYDWARLTMSLTTAAFLAAEITRDALPTRVDRAAWLHAFLQIAAAACRRL